MHLNDGLDVFVAYQRADQPRAERLIGALQTAGIQVWWDAHLPAGESWQQGIEAALGGSACVVVLWSETSVGPKGNFVRDEARLAKQAGRMVPVLIDGVPPPLGFGELQAST
jgi:hypothetical protein